MALQGELVYDGTGRRRGRAPGQGKHPEKEDLNNEAQRLHELELLLDEAIAVIRRMDPPADIQTVQAATANYRQLLPLRNKQSSRVMAARDAVIRAEHERRDAAEWETKEEEIYNRLIVQYKILGPQYEILVRSVSHAFVHLEQMSRSGRNVPIREWQASLKAVVDSIRAIQQYTESRKVDVQVEMERAVVMKVVQIAQAQIAPSAPQLFENFIHAIRRDALAAAGEPAPVSGEPPAGEPAPGERLRANG